MPAKRVVSLLLLSALATPALAVSSAPDPERSEIVVTGIRLNDAKRDLDACLARNCPPLEDMAATLKYAEALFLEGKYRQARLVLSRSIGRNKDSAAQHPVGVAGLYRANARMAMHEGDGEDARRSAYNVERALRRGLQPNDARIIGAKLEKVELHAALDQPHIAERLLEEAAEQARKIRRPDLEALAMLRGGMLARRLGRQDARKRLEAIAALTDPRTQIQQLGAKIVLAEMRKEAGDEKAFDEVIRELRSAGLKAPVLVHAPGIKVPHASMSAGYASMGEGGASESIEMRNMSTMTPMDGSDFWADLGFWIDSDGRVREVSVLRSHGPKHWLKPVLSSIEGRVYYPPDADDLSYRVERYRYTSLLERRSDSRIATHSAQPRIEMLDITNSATVEPKGEGPAEPRPLR